MGLIRTHSRRGQAELFVGDPGLGRWFKRATRIPRSIRKFQPGKALGRIAAGLGPFASFLPGVGPVLAQLAARFRIPEPVMAQIAMDYGIGTSGAGNYEGDPGPPRKRKKAASGTKAKAQEKAKKRGAPRTTRKQRGGKKGPTFEIPPGLGDELGALLRQGAELIPGPQKELDPDAIVRKFGMPRGGAGHRRSMNPTNVRALRRSIRRLEGFSRVIKSVRKAARGLRGDLVAAHGGSVVRRSGRGHKSGCSCAVCRRAA